jgi:hypothetical protein
VSGSNLAGVESSKSSPDGPSMSWFIRESLRTLQEELPEAYYLMCARLAGKEVLLRVSDEPVSLAFKMSGVQVLNFQSNPDVRLETSRAVILKVLDAEQTLEESVLNGDILLMGYTRDLSAFHEGLILYVGGAVRSPGFPFLLDRFRRWEGG